MGRGNPHVVMEHERDSPKLNVWCVLTSNYVIGPFFFGFVYQTPVQGLDNLRLRIIDACASVTPQMLQNTWREIEYRLDILRATKGAHVEIY